MCSGAPPTCQVAAAAAHSVQLLAIRQIRPSLRTVLKRSNPQLRPSAVNVRPRLLTKRQGPESEAQPSPHLISMNTQFRYQQNLPSYPDLSVVQHNLRQATVRSQRLSESFPPDEHRKSRVTPRLPLPAWSRRPETVESEARKAGSDEELPGQTMSVET